MGECNSECTYKFQNRDNDNAVTGSRMHSKLRLWWLSAVFALRLLFCLQVTLGQYQPWKSPPPSSSVPSCSPLSGTLGPAWEVVLCAAESRLRGPLGFVQSRPQLVLSAERVLSLLWREVSGVLSSSTLKPTQGKLGGGEIAGERES